MALVASSVGHAQTAAQRGLEPVDQMVEDVDPLAVSLRQREAGLSTIGQGGRVFRYITPPKAEADDQRLVYVDRGFVAEFDRAQYGLVVDRSTDQALVLQMIPPNTVFHLGLPRPPGPSGDTPADAPYLPGQIDGRTDGRLAWTSPTPPGDLPVLEKHQRRAVAQRAVVLKALHRIAGAD